MLENWLEIIRARDVKPIENRASAYARRDFSFALDSALPNILFGRVI